MEKVSSSNAQRAQYSQEPKQPARNDKARSYEKLSPDQQRAESIARKPKPAVKTLGSRIDVYA
ncbi:MAG: hypothetical protein Kow0029_16820 [Candidatus Rifleibacteriota bacterium]